MKVSKTHMGFEVIMMPEVIRMPDRLTGEVTRIVQQSSALGEAEDAIDRPGSSYLWLGESHHLDVDEVVSLIRNLENWVATGSLVGSENDA